MREPGLHTLTYADLMRVLRVSRPSLTAWMRGVDVPVLTDEDRRHRLCLADVVCFLRRPGGRLRGLEGAELRDLVALDASRRAESGPARVSGDVGALRAVLTADEEARAIEVIGAARSAVVRTRWTDAASVPADSIESILLSPPVLRYVLTGDRAELPVGSLDDFVTAHVTLNMAKEAA